MSRVIGIHSKGHIVQVLGDMLKRAETGQIESFVVSFIEKGNTHVSAWGYQADANKITLLGAIEDLKLSFALKEIEYEFPGEE